MMHRFVRMACALLACAWLAQAASAAAVIRTPEELRAREIFARVIAYRTSVGLGQVPAMAEYLAGQFRAAGFPAADIHMLPLGETASLVVRYRGDGTGGKPILLLSHMDVVTARREDWQRDPFTLTEENGFFYGRGTFDIKESLTCLVATLLRFKAEGVVPRRDLVLLLTGDEETTMDTARDVISNHRELVDAEFALNPDAGSADLDEATGRAMIYGVETAEKTYANYELTVRNPGGHSAEPRADNAIYELAAALGKLQGYQFPVMSNETTRAFFAGSAALAPGPLGEAMRKFASDPHDAAAAQFLSQDPHYVGMLRTTCIPTMLRGGHAENALPESATVNVNCRIFPGIDPAAVRQTLQEIVPAGVEVRMIGEPFWSDASPLRPDVWDAVTRTVHALHPGIPIVPRQDSGASENILTRAAGIPTYGTFESFIKPSDYFAHGLNEREPVASFYEGLRFWYMLLKDLAGPKPGT
ncbi:MAG: M20/M25/M40 family metallo-hydrolase [Gammaproteobacteria bacterium]|nr:M20/M25/M40 family metallo-hydrolase [Gammaproteobacteria bacterium]